MSPQAIAREAIEKARYFLSQAEIAERDPEISRAQLPYIANLEAAIICGRSTLDHLKNEFASKSGYRQWHDAEWRRLETYPLFIFLTDRRHWIVHRAAENVSLTFNVSIVMSASLSVVCDATVIRGQPWYRRPPKILWRDWIDSRAARKHRKEPLKDPPIPAQTQTEFNKNFTLQIPNGNRNRLAFSWASTLTTYMMRSRRARTASVVKCQHARAHRRRPCPPRNCRDAHCAASALAMAATRRRTRRPAAVAPAERVARLMRFAERAEQPKTCSRETQVSCAGPSGSGALADKLVRRPVCSKVSPRTG